MKQREIRRQTRSERRADRRGQRTGEVIQFQPKFAEQRRPTQPLLPRTVRQESYLEALRTSQQVIATGVAGTGKTWVAATYFADQYRMGKISRIIITKPNAPAGRSFGFLPGTLDDKVAPWAAGILEALKERMGAAPLEIALKAGDIEIVPFETMRGRTFKHCAVILTEAQNTLVGEMQMFLTRIGEDCQVVMDGDVMQKDIPERSGLAVVLELIQRGNMEIPVIEFGIEDIVRSGICRDWVVAFHKAGY